MKSTPIYAVVDIETTGTNTEKDRIIQLGCVFVQENHIISRFAADINPRKKITKQIENLTGITNEQVANAPYMEDVASDIYNQLKDCIFVAHNIYFDYQFLSKELQRCGLPRLTIPGIDTVELAQIFLPSAQSFRLSDLAEQLNIQHDRPHQADSDAEVTAELFLYLEDKMRQLPMVTMERIVMLSDQCGMETQEYIIQIVEEMQQKRAPLNEKWRLVNGIALKKKEISSFDYQNNALDIFPKKQKKKEELYDGKLEYRKVQGKMMNLVYEFFQPNEKTSEKLKEKNLAIEASTGTGKTFAYLLPMSYLATPEKPVVISTVSVLLENQILEQAVPFVNKIRPNSLVATLLKSHQHYIDLARFFTTLEKPVKQKQYALYQMGVLVWLTETDTGDLDELNLSTLNHVFFKQIKHRGLAFLDEDSLFYQEDFWLFILNRVKQSNVIIVNHAFLIQENYRTPKLLTETPYLIIDEAHHLPEIAQKAGFHHVNDYEVGKLIYSLLNDEEQVIGLNSLKRNEEWQKESRALKNILHEIEYTMEQLREDILETILIDYHHQYDDEVLITNESLENMPIYIKKNVYRFNLLLAEATELYEQIKATFKQELRKWTETEKETMSEWLELLERLKELGAFVLEFVSPTPSNIVKWLKIQEKNQLISAYLGDFSASLVEDSAWYQRFDKILYTGGTIRVGKDTQFLARSLGLEQIPFKSLPTTYNYAEQARLFIPTESYAFQDLHSEEYIRFVSNTVKSLAKQEKKPILVLFNSHDMLQKVYQHLHYQMLIEGTEVLAQGLSGSREKIMKRFVHSATTILLGTDSFWEGVDLPGKTLEIIVVTRLPFESPERPFVKEKYQFLEEQGIHSFYKYALPKAALRLRQGFGRLIRSEQDKGVMIVLDKRLIKAKYGSVLRHALPKDLPIIECTQKDMMSQISKFL